MVPLIRTAALAIVVCAAPILAQEPRNVGAAPSSAAKPLLTEADFARIETLGATALSPDGKWIAYDFRRGASGPTELRYRAVAGSAESSVPLGHTPVFSATNRWLLFTITPDTAALGRGAGGRAGAAAGGRGTAAAPVAEASRNKIGIVDLRSGKTTIVEQVQSFALSKNGTYVALRRYAPVDGRARGADLVVRDLEQGTDLTFGNVTEFAWSDTSALLAIAVDVDGSVGNGVQLLDASTGALRGLDAGDHVYMGIAWRKHGDDLAVLRSRADSAFVDTAYTVLAWRGLLTAHPVKAEYDFAADRSFPSGMRVAAYRRPLWADGGASLFFGIAPREPKDSAWNGAQPARVEVWHWKDLREYHQQDRQASQDRQKTQLVAWHLTGNRLVRLADDSTDAVQLSEGQGVALTSDERPYFNEVISGRQYRDVYRIDPATGQRERVATKTVYPAAVSPADVTCSIRKAATGGRTT